MKRQGQFCNSASVSMVSLTPPPNHDLKKDDGEQRAVYLEKIKSVK